jgi:hypothetical protein
MVGNIFKRKAATGTTNGDKHSVDTTGRTSDSQTSQDVNNLEVNDKDAPQGRAARHKDVPYVTVYTALLTSKSIVCQRGLQG